MPSRSEYQRRREQFARSSEQESGRRIAGLRARLLELLLPALLALATDDRGRLLFNVSNLSQASRVALLVEAFSRAEGFNLLRWVFSRLLGLFGLNKEYFSAAVPSAPESLDDRVRRLTLLRYGYDVAADRIDPGGYLAGNAQSPTHAQLVARRINEAIASRTPLREFVRAFRADFTNPASALSLDYHYQRFSRDLFQEFDRTVQAEYAQELGLTYAIYSGTVKDNTRHFCARRVNNIYNEKEIDKWNGQKWQGKKPGVDVRTAAGGYNCRHHFSWISEETARQIAEDRGGINHYNTVL